jgi:hypothetical protein
MKKPKKPIRLITPKQLRLEHGLSWHRVQRRVDRGQIIPFAFTLGPGGNEGHLWHPDQLPELLATCKNRLQKPPWIEEAKESDEKA